MHSTIRTVFSATAMVGALVWLGACDNAISPDQPPCDHPAPLNGTYDAAAPGFIVQYHGGVDAVAETKILAAKYNFTPTFVWTSALQGFAAQMSTQAVAGVRCEASVLEVEHDGRAYAF